MKELRQSSQRGIFSDSLLQVKLEMRKMAKFLRFEHNLKT